MENQDNRVTLCADGKYRWAYEMNLYRNPAVLYDVLKVMGLTLGLVYVMMIVFMLFDDPDWESVLTITGVFGGIWLFMMVIGLLGYWIWAAINGGRYAVMFEMDEQGVVHYQMPNHVKKQQVISAIGTMVGVATGSLSLVGTSLVAGSVTSWRTAFADVRKVIPVKRHHQIKVNELIVKNRVYVEDADFDFVLDYIRSHCPKVQ